MDYGRGFGAASIGALHRSEPEIEGRCVSSLKRELANEIRLLVVVPVAEVDAAVVV
jgi:hypothetical protein